MQNKVLDDLYLVLDLIGTEMESFTDFSINRAKKPICQPTESMYWVPGYYIKRRNKGRTENDQV